MLRNFEVMCPEVTHTAGVTAGAFAGKLRSLCLPRPLPRWGAKFGPQWCGVPRGWLAPAGCRAEVLPRCGAGPCGGSLLCGWGYGQRGQPGGPWHRVALWGGPGRLGRDHSHNQTQKLSPTLHLPGLSTPLLLEISFLSCILCSLLPSLASCPRPLTNYSWLLKNPPEPLEPTNEIQLLPGLGLETLLNPTQSRRTAPSPAPTCCHSSHSEGFFFS